jgi:hypothetical protein
VESLSVVAVRVCPQRSPLDFFCQNVLATAIGAFVNFASAMLALAKLEIIDAIIGTIAIDVVDGFIR